MCGIAGMMGISRELAEEAAPRMLAALRRRGPDGSGSIVVADPTHVGPPAVLLHARLAIQDTSAAAHQPMHDARVPGCHANWIVFNGEIYNHRELRQRLSPPDGGWQSRSDTEVILRAYRVWGEDAVTRMRGMFAWCLLDSKHGRAWFCRDRLGIKPLYLFRPRCGGLLFASEVRTLLAAGPKLVPREIDAAAIEAFLAQGAVWGANSIVRGIQMLPPGSSMFTDWSGNEIGGRAYWKLDFYPPESPAAPRELRATRRAAAPRIAETLRDSLQMHLRADVPVGLLLSGGVDSAATATVATEVAGAGLTTVCIGFDQPAFDETDAAGAVAAALGTRHSALQLSGEDVVEDFASVLAAADQPTVDGFNTYFVARAARRAGLKVALSGLGGDELFGGYASFRDVPGALRWRRRLSWLRSVGVPLRMLARGAGGRRGAKALAVLERPASPLQMYLLRRELFLPWQRRRFYSLPADTDEFSGMPREFLQGLLASSRRLDAFNQVSLFEMNGYLRHMLLRDADVFSMAHGLELRVPLLDHRLVEQVAGLPGECKQSERPAKRLLIDAVGPRLPAEVPTRPKRGFTFPWDAWLRGPLQKIAGRSLANADAWRKLGMNPSAATALWQQFQRRDRQVSPLQIVALMVLEDYSVRHDLRRSA